MPTALSDLLGFGPAQSSTNPMMSPDTPASRLAMMMRMRGRKPTMSMKQGLRFAKGQKGQPIPRSAAGVPGVTARSITKRKVGQASRFIRQLVFMLSGKEYNRHNNKVKAIANDLLKLALQREKTKTFPLITYSELEKLYASTIPYV